jgi:hypothetical protein
MTPYEKALAAHLLSAWNTEESDESDLLEDIYDHIQNGIVISTERLFLLARPVNSKSDHYLFDYPSIGFKDPDCWHIYLASGSLPDIFNALPYPLPLVSYVRKNRLHFQDMKKMGLKVNSSTFSFHGRKTETSESSAKG